MVCSSWLKLVGFVVLYIMSMLSAEVKAEVDRILGSEYGDLAKWKAMCGYLLKQKIFYYSTIKVDELLVHDQNRGGSGISVHNAHSKGAIILKAGCDPTMLHSSTCFEISPNPSKRAAQTACSEKLWEAHKDFFAKPHGGERYLSVSSSHFSQFCKALATGCKSPIGELTDVSGKMSLAMHSHDKELVKIMQEGWSWLCIPWYIEDMLCCVFSE